MAKRLWLYRSNGDGEFVLLVNSGTRNSRRHYDANTGILRSEGSGQGSIPEEVFREIIRTSVAIEGLSGKVTEFGRHLDQDALNTLRSQISHAPVVTSGSVQLVHATSILEGFDDAVDAALGLSDLSYHVKTAAIRLSQSPVSIDGPQLIRRLYALIERNWDRSECRSRELWRWRAMPQISPLNDSPEKTLEKAIVSEGSAWVNQIPAASGLLRHCEERHRNVDLGHQLGPREYELIELKAGPNADTPLRAAFEILGYGLLYCFARLHLHELALPIRSQLLHASTIRLKVLGPCEVYRGFALDWLARVLDRGVRAFSAARFGPDLSMTFAFETFPPEFRWPGMDAEQLRECLSRRSRDIWGQEA